MSKKSLDLAGGEKLWRKLCGKSGLPFSFCYGGKLYSGLSGVRKCTYTESVTERGRRGEFSASIDRELRVTVDTAYCSEFGQVEYTVWLENTGKRPAKALSR